MGDLMFIADMVADETWKSNPRTGQNECRRSSDRDSGFVICDLELGAFRSFRTLEFRVCSMLEVPLPLLVGGTSLSRFRPDRVPSRPGWLDVLRCLATLSHE
jgi:hypothetical protein